MTDEHDRRWPADGPGAGRAGSGRRQDLDDDARHAQLGRQRARLGRGESGADDRPVALEEPRVPVAVVAREQEGRRDAERPELGMVGQDVRQAVAVPAELEELALQVPVE